MSGEVHKLPGASQAAAAGPLAPLRDRGPRRGRAGRAFERELLERGDAASPPASARSVAAPASPHKPCADPETGGTLDLVA